PAWTAIASAADGAKLAAGNYDGFGNPIFISTNFGGAWIPSGAPFTNQWVSVASSADGAALMASYPGGGFVPGGVFTSTNSGLTWYQYLHDNYAAAPFSWNSVSCSANGQIMIAATGVGS